MYSTHNIQGEQNVTQPIPDTCSIYQKIKDIKSQGKKKLIIYFQAISHVSW
jgi:hypothetical protein